MTSSPGSPAATRLPWASTTARSQPSSGRPIRTGGSPSSRAPHATTVASVGPYVFHTSRSGVARRAPISGGQASPPRMSRRTSSSAASGHRVTRVGTVETTVMSLARSHGPRSMPDRTSDRGAGTRQAPYRQASHISSQLASKATDRPAITRSPGPRGRCCTNIRASASTNAAALRWLTATPFGVPVEPEVKMTQASSVGEGVVLDPGVGVGPGREDDEVGGHDRGHAGLAEDQPGALVGVVAVDRHVGGARQQDADDRHVEVGRAGRDPHADPVAAPGARLAQRRGDLQGGRQQLVVGQHHPPVVEGRRVGVGVGRGAQHVDERAGGRRVVGAKERVGDGGRGGSEGRHDTHCVAPGAGGQSVQRRRPRRPAWTSPTRTTPTKTVTSSRDAAPRPGSRSTSAHGKR